jgi:hypothetical protein
MGRGYTGGSLKRQAQPPEIAKSPHALCRTSVWRQSLVPKPQAIIQGQLPPREILPSSSSSLPIYCWHLSSALRKTLRFICNHRRVICLLPANRVGPTSIPIGYVCFAIFVEALLPFAEQSYLRLPLHKI